jgi:HK97 family phage major capsid protein
MMDAFEAFNPADLVYAMNASYRQNGAFVMNRKMQSAVRKFKDTTTARRTSSPQWDGFTR